VFSRFSPASKRVLRAAEQECRNHNDYYLGVEHVLLALLDEHDQAIESRLARRSLKAGELRVELRRRLGTGEDRLWEGILVTPRVRAIVTLA
jgi:ATP-dependent Clp protease ATP-binding subunit ClpA